MPLWSSATSLVTLSLFLLPFDQDSCTLISPSEAAALLGAAVTTVEPVPADLDEDTGAQRTGCLYESPRLSMALLVLTYDSPAAASASMSDEMIAEQLPDPEVSLAPEAGLGDRAYWASMDELSSMIAVSGRYVVGVTVGGDGFTNAADYRTALKQVLEAALRRL